MSAQISNAVRGRITAALFVAVSLFSAATIAGFTVGVIVVADLAGSDNAAGLPSTMTLVGRAVAAYPVGWLLDRLGRRSGLAIGYLIGVLGAAVAVWAVLNGSFLGFLAGSLLVGGARASSDQARYIGPEVFPPLQRGRVIGFIIFAGTIGAVGGPALVGPTSAWAAGLGLNPYAGPFIASALLIALAGLVVFLFVRPDPLQLSKLLAAEAAGEDGPPAAVAPARPLSVLFANRLILLAMWAMIVGHLVMSLLMVITPLHMAHHDHGPGDIGLVISAHTLGMFGLSWLSGWLIDRFGRRPIMLLGALVLTLACALAPLSTTVPLLALALFLLGLGWNF